MGGGGGGVGWEIVRKKRGKTGGVGQEQNRWEGGWKRKHAVKVKDEKEKEQEEGDSKNLFFVTLQFLFTQIQTKKLLFAGLHTPVHSHTR